jgi:putative ABC transport system permease protein
MIRNFFTIAWRTVRKNKAYAGINVLGLSLGIACSILIFALVHYHFSFDGFHRDKARIYRIVTEFHDEVADYSQGTPGPLGKTFRKEFNYAEKTACVVSYESALISFQTAGETKKFLEAPGVAYAEPEYFDIFNFPLIRGEKATALRAPDQALITEKLARKYFGDANAAMGRSIRINNKTDFLITGILQDIPVNTDRRQEIYLSYENVKERDSHLLGDSTWGHIYSQHMSFVRLRPTVTVAQVNKGLALIGTKYQQGRDAQTTLFRLQPLADIHFNPTFDGSVDKKYLWALAFIGLFILVTACVNFINLATAQALNRSTEVAIRKVLGGVSRQLFWQFITETALIAVFAAIVGYSIAGAILPALNTVF